MELFTKINKKTEQAVVAVYEEITDKAGKVKEFTENIFKNDFETVMSINNVLRDKVYVNIANPDFRIIAQESGHVDILFNVVID